LKLILRKALIQNVEKYVEKCLYFFDKFLTFPDYEVVNKAEQIISNLLKKKRSRKIMKNYFLSLTISNWKAKRLFTGKLLFAIFPDYIKGCIFFFLKDRKEGNHFCRRLDDPSSPGP
jgi:hypothetical protein